MEAHEIARFLRDNSDFFSQHADVFAFMKVPHPYDGRAISLTERQVLALRERNKGLEAKLAELLRRAEENAYIGERLLVWSRSLLAVPEVAQLPEVLCSSLQEVFTIPEVQLRLWEKLPAELLDSTWAQPVSDSSRRFADGLTVPFCGPSDTLEVAEWFEAPIQSVAMIAIRVGMAPQAFGLLALGSPDPTRYTSGMGTDFLMHIGELASAALSRIAVEAGQPIT